MTTKNNDTICAISTPAGVGGIAVVRISGPQAIEISQNIWHGKNLMQCTSHTAHLGMIVDPDTPQAPLDQAVATIYRSPNSFTGEDTVELAIHGSTYIQTETVGLLTRQGCRMAEPGEFTRRAFTNARIDLTQAEATADLIASTSQAAHRIAITQMRGRFADELNRLRQQLIDLTALLELELDFSEEEVEFANRADLHHIATQTLNAIKHLADSFRAGNAIKNGINVAIVGKPNVGKSSILNLIVGDEKAIVSDIPGTTRDIVEDTINIDGQTYRFIDTAGLRHTTDIVEKIGVTRAMKQIEHAHIILWIITPGQPQDITRQTLEDIKHNSHPGAIIIPIINKTDLHTQQEINLEIDTTSQLIAESGNQFCNINTATNSQSTPLQTAAAIPEQRESLNPTNSIPLSTDRTKTLHYTPAITTSAKTTLTESLREYISQVAKKYFTSNDNDTIITNLRHYQALQASIPPLSSAIAALSPNPTPDTPTSISADFISQDIREALHHLGTILGTVTTTDILSTIFSRFCIGK